MSKKLTSEWLDDLDWLAKAELDYWHTRAESLDNRKKINEAVLVLTAEMRRRDAEATCSSV
jgi:hypothetical protein